jgi:hypothetical protein
MRGAAKKVLFVCTLLNDIVSKINSFSLSLSLSRKLFTIFTWRFREEGRNDNEFFVLSLQLPRKIDMGRGEKREKEEFIT